MIHDTILTTIGNTPVVRINRLAPVHIDLFVKIEAFNPMASVKDRLAFAIIQDAENRGLLRPGQTVVEATSGNTGIALAMVCAAKGYQFVAVMAESFSLERRQLMRFMGAKVILTPAAERATGMVEMAEKLAETNGWFLANQFNNKANPAYHRNTTAPEILRDFANQRLDYFVSGWGTGGTMTGTGEVLKAARPDMKVITCDPTVAPVLSGGQWQPHKIQGWTPDFIPSILNKDICDDTVYIDDELAIATSRELATEEGIFCGISAGATLAAAIKVAETAPSGSSILAMLPDTGERYLSTPLFEGIAEGSDDELLENLAEP